MKKDMVITDGEKLRAIREKYKLKQSDVVGKDITRNLLSEIETGKAVITKNTAEIIIKNLKELSKKRGFEVTETVDYLMENTFVQAAKILDDYIAKLKLLLISKDESFAETLKESKGFLASWNINEKAAIIYELAGDYFYIQSEMYESILYYEKALSSIGKLSVSDELLKIFSKISIAYIHGGNYDKAIESCTFVIDHFENLSLKNMYHFMYNRAYSYFLLNKYDRALASIDKIEGFVSEDDKQNYFMLLDTKAACFYELTRYDEALELYTRILKVLDDNDIDKKIVIYINMAEVYMKLYDMNKANELLDKAKKELPFINSDSRYEADIYYELGKIYKEGNKVEASKYYSQALETSKKHKNYVLVADVLYDLMQCENNIKNIDIIKNEVFIISSKQEKLADKLIHKLINFYAANKDISKVLEINNFALQFI